MNIPPYARYNYCAEKACEFIEEYKIQSFPINPLEIIETEHYGILAYSELMSEYGCSLERVCSCMRSHEGKTILEGDIYSIAYNDNKSSMRIRFTLMHELGHIFLNHLEDFEKTEMLRDGKLQTGLSKNEYKVLENEANAFARNVLSPVSMYLTLKDKSIKNVSFTFGISSLAAETRIDFIGRDVALIKGLNLSQKIMFVYNRFMKKRKCSICGGQFFVEHEYCCICGSKHTLQWGDGKMIYQKLETHEYGKLKECPRCHNEDTDIDGEYCQICSRSLINTCSNESCQNSNSTLPSNARYCPECGSQTTFLGNNTLQEWDYRKPDNVITGFMQIPDVALDEIDEELPFN